MENWSAQEWLFIIGAGIVLLVAYINREKLKKLGGGGRRGDDNQKRR